MWVQKERVRLLPCDLAPTPLLLAPVQEETQFAIYIDRGENIKRGKTSWQRSERGDTGLLL